VGLDTVETVLWAEKSFGIDIPDSDAAGIRTVGAFSAYIHARLVALNVSDPPSECDVFEGLKTYLVMYLKVRPELIRREASFVQDLGLD